MPIILANSEGDYGCRVIAWAVFMAEFLDHVGILFLARQFWSRKKPGSYLQQQELRIHDAEYGKRLW